MAKAPKKEHCVRLRQSCYVLSFRFLTLKMGPTGCPETRQAITSSCCISHKSENFI